LIRSNSSILKQEERRLLPFIFSVTTIHELKNHILPAPCKNDIFPLPTTRKNLGYFSCALFCFIFVSFAINFPLSLLLFFFHIFYFFSSPFSYFSHTTSGDIPPKSILHHYA
jgi:hypothetical protein